MTEHYTKPTPDDELFVCDHFKGFVERPSGHGNQPRSEAIFYFTKDEVPGSHANFDIYRPIFRVTGASIAGIAPIPNGYRVTVSANSDVRSTIETILANHGKNVKSTRSR